MLKSHFKEDKTIKQGFSAMKCLEKISGKLGLLMVVLVPSNEIFLLLQGHVGYFMDSGG